MSTATKTKIYALIENSLEYNDQDYYFTEGGETVKAFRSKANADAECARLNKERKASGEYTVEDNDAPEYYKVAEVEVEDDDLTTYADAQSKLAALRKQAQELAQSAFKEESDKLFVKFPTLESFSWRQYTPYFNDGDTCTFCVHDDCDINGVDNDEIHKGYPGYNGGTPTPPSNPELIPLAVAARELVGKFNYEDMEQMFGDHVKVTVTRDKVETDELEHD